MSATFHEESINTGSQAFDIVVGQYGDAKGTKDQFEKTDPSCLHGPIAALGDTKSFAEHIASRLEDVRTRLSDAWQGDTAKGALDIVAAMHTDASQISTSAARCASALAQFQQQWTSARSQALNLYEGVLGTGLNEDNGQAHTIFREFCQAMSDRMHDMPGTLTYHDGLNPYEQYGGGTGPGGSGYGGSGGSFGGGGGVPGGRYGGTGTVGSLDPGYPHHPGSTGNGGGPGTVTPAPGAPGGPGGPGGYPGFPGPGGGSGSGAPGGSWPGGAGGAGLGSGTTTLSGYSGPDGGTSGIGGAGGGGFGIPGGGGAGGIGAAGALPGGALPGGGAGVTGNASGGIVPMATVGPAGVGGGSGGTRAGVMPMRGGRGGEDADRDRSTWLDEDDDVWGAAEGLPPVLS